MCDYLQDSTGDCRRNAMISHRTPVSKGMKQEGSWGLREKPGRGNSTEDKKRREDLVKVSTTEKWLTTI